MFKSTASPPTEALTLYLSLGGKEGRDRKRTTVQGSWIMVLKTRCAPELREAYFMGVSLLPLCKVGTPSMRRTREKRKSTGRWSFQMGATSSCLHPAQSGCLWQVY